MDKSRLLFSALGLQACQPNSISGHSIQPSARTVISMPLRGDANNDGQVTGADLIAVQANFGATEPADDLLFGDANDEGMITGLDLTTAQQNFSNVLSSAAAAMSAPASVCRLTLASLGTMARRRRVAN